MRLITQIGLAAGVLLLIGLVLWQGATDVMNLLATSGIWLLLLPVVWAPCFLPAAQAWRMLFPDSAPSFGRAVVAIWIGRAINNVVPAANLGSEVVKARLAFIWGCPAPSAVASVVVDKTVQIAALLLWGLIGVALLLHLTGAGELARYALIGFGVLGIAVAGLFAAQRAGMLGFLAHLGGRLLKIDAVEGMKVSAADTDLLIQSVYRRAGDVTGAVLLRTLALAWQSIEVWLGCLLLGHPVGIAEAMMIRCLTTTLGDVAFVVPNAYGVQEGAFIVVGGLVGIPAETALALSLALRIRDLLFDPPAFLVLHRIESSRWGAART